MQSLFACSCLSKSQEDAMNLVSSSSFALPAEYPTRWDYIRLSSGVRRKGAFLCINKFRKSWKRPTAQMSDPEDLWASLSRYIGKEADGVDSAAKDHELVLSNSLFEDASLPQMEVEEPAEYMPPPPISETDLDFNVKLENVLYILRDILPGSVRKIGVEDELCRAYMLIHDEVNVEDSFIYIHGKERLSLWLHKLADLDVRVDLHEIYAESIMTNPRKGCIHIIWTLTFPQQQNESSAENQLEVKLSGESSLDLCYNGQVISVQPKWYTKEERVKDILNEYFSDLLIE